MAVVAVVLLSVLVLNRIVEPYYALLPGDALAVNGPGGTVTIHNGHPGSGDLFLTTVALQNRVTLWDRLFSFLHPDESLIKKTVLTGGASPAEFQQQSQQEMSDAELDAKVAALRRLGYQVPEHGDGALIVQVDPSSPAAGNFEPGDVVKQLDGKPVQIASDAIADIRAHKPGDEVKVVVSRPGVNPSNVRFTVRPVACAQRCPGDPGRAFVGVSLATDQVSFDFPKQVGLSIDAGDIGGPSAGLAFALGVIDALGSHHLTGGHKVAVTGTIDSDGNVGPVGGVEQKTVAVLHAGIQYFLVPPDEYSGALSKAKGHHLTVVKVSTLDQALAFLKSIGGDLRGVPTKSPLASA